VILLDASAILALLYDEPGADTVAGALTGDTGALSLVNLAEVLEVLERYGANSAGRLPELRRLVTFEPVTEADALRAAELAPLTRRPALSLADRFALATAHRLSAPALTAEQAWAEYKRETLGVEVRLIR